MLTVHIAGKPERDMQRCFRCNRVLVDNRRSGQLQYWKPGDFIAAYDDGRNGHGLRDRDADESDPDERQCECAPANVDGGPVVECYQ
jgi:hypothetical protein